MSPAVFFRGVHGRGAHDESAMPILTLALDDALQPLRSSSEAILRDTPV